MCFYLHAEPNILTIFLFHIISKSYAIILACAYKLQNYDSNSVFAFDTVDIDEFMLMRCAKLPKKKHCTRI